MTKRKVELRNLTVHTYSERTAVTIYRNLNDYEPLFEELLRGLLRAPQSL